MRKLLPSAAIAILISATSAFAASQYYVVHKAGGGACSVTTKKPDGKTEMMARDRFVQEPFRRRSRAENSRRVQEVTVQITRFLTRGTHRDSLPMSAAAFGARSNTGAPHSPDPGGS